MANFWFREDNVYFDRVLADMNQPTFADSAFDIVLCCSTLFCSLSILPVLIEIHKILKPQGRLILVSEPNLGIFQRRAKRQWRKDYPGQQPHTIPEWMGLVKKAGFQEVNIFFPESVTEKLLNGQLISKKQSWYYLAASVISFPWRVAYFRQFVIRRCTYLLLLLTPVALPLLMIARKRA